MQSMLNKRISISFMMIIVVFALIGCSNRTPVESDFSLSYNLSEEQVTTGNEIVVTATLTNLSKTNYKIEYSSFLIGIFPADEEGVVLSIIFNELTLHSHDSVRQSKTISFDDSGEYEYVVVAIFNVGDQGFTYRVPFNINVTN